MEGHLAERVVNSSYELPAASIIDQLYHDQHGKRGATARRNEAIQRLIYQTEAGPRYFLDLPR